MNIDEMQAGREFDALIAERVMKWSSVDFDEIGQAWTGVPPNENGHYAVIRYYSTDMTAAWQVVEKLDLFHEPSLLCYSAEKKLWLVEKQVYYETFDLVSSANTAPLAICRAALKVIEEQVNA